MDAEKQAKALLWCFARLTAREREAVLHLAQELVAGEPTVEADLPPAPLPVPAVHGFTTCADCGEHRECYTRKGVPRCSDCRRKLPFKEEEKP